MSLKQAAKDALSIKCDVDCFNALAKLRRECREKGLDPERVNRIIRAANHELNRKPEPKPDAGVPPEELPATQEKQKEVSQLQELPEQVSRRTRQSYEAPPDKNASGGNVRKSKLTILDIADGKQTI